MSKLPMIQFESLILKKHSAKTRWSRSMVKDEEYVSQMQHLKISNYTWFSLRKIKQNVFLQFCLIFVEESEENSQKIVMETLG